MKANKTETTQNEISAAQEAFDKSRDLIILACTYLDEKREKQQIEIFLWFIGGLMFANLMTYGFTIILAVQAIIMVVLFWVRSKIAYRLKMLRKHYILDSSADRIIILQKEDKAKGMKKEIMTTFYM